MNAALMTSSDAVGLPPHAQRLKTYFENLSAADVPRLREFYAPDAWFKDPFNEVRSISAIERIFSHMFVQVRVPRFLIHQAIIQHDHFFLTWDFIFRSEQLGPGEQVIRGATHIRFGADGRVIMHRDYWDAAEELYEKIPLLGTLMRFLKRRGSAGHKPA